MFPYLVIMDLFAKVQIRITLYLVPTTHTILIDADQKFGIVVNGPFTIPWGHRTDWDIKSEPVDTNISEQVEDQVMETFCGPQYLSEWNSRVVWGFQYKLK